MTLRAEKGLIKRKNSKKQPRMHNVVREEEAVLKKLHHLAGTVLLEKN